MARITQRMLDLVGKSLAEDWSLAHERLKAAARDRLGAAFVDVVVHETPPGPTGLVMRTFTGTVTWNAANGVSGSSAFVATATIATFADMLSGGDFDQLLNIATRGNPGTPFNPAST